MMSACARALSSHSGIGRVSGMTLLPGWLWWQQLS